MTYHIYSHVRYIRIACISVIYIFYLLFFLLSLGHRYRNDIHHNRIASTKACVYSCRYVFGRARTCCICAARLPLLDSRYHWIREMRSALVRPTQNIHPTVIHSGPWPQNWIPLLECASVSEPRILDMLLHINEYYYTLILFTYSSVWRKINVLQLKIGFR